MSYTPIKTDDLEDVKLSYTTKQVFDILNNNASELDDRADKEDAKFEAIEKKLDTIETNATKVEPSETNGNIKINGNETPVYRLPQLTPSDVGADPAGTAASAVAAHNTSSTAHTDIRNLVSAAQSRADDAYSLAEGRENAVSYADYQAMVTAFNAETAPTLKVGDNIYIETVGVPDLWVSGILDSKASYTYTDDQAIVDALDDPSVGFINIGWYRLDELETAKVDLSGYVPTTTTVTGAGALGGGGDLSQNRTITHNAGSAANKASGLYKISTDAYSHVSGATAVQTSDLTSLLNDSYLKKANPTGTGSLVVGSDLATSANPITIKATGTNSQAVGTGTTASGDYSNAIGEQTTASGEASHAEGIGTSARSQASHAEGYHTIAGDSSTNYERTAAHAEGIECHAFGKASHAEGTFTIAKHYAQHVFGSYNKEDESTYGPDFKGKYIEIVGNGAGESNRRNARTLDWSGNEVLAGTSTATGFKTPSGTASQFLKADGSVDGTTYATQDYVDGAVGAIDTKKTFTFTASDARWSSSLVDGVYTLTMDASNTTGFVAGKIPFACFNSNNEQVMATLGFTASSITVKSDTKFAGTVYAI